LVGFFVNSLALRTQVEQTQSLENFIAQVHEVVSGAKVHQELPFENVVELLEVERDRARHPIYQVMFSVQGFGGALEAENSLPFDMVTELG
ncbi:condensation domain-containing protein, partial [Pseudoalteromonas byunsanensis]|uniref:condensation domain-containing protein n=1 Tax=Pseudoalteromonas byunsanensis TaxID=327939 RepID=UPI0011138718